MIVMSLTQAPSFPLVNIVPYNNKNIIVQWTDGEVQPNINDEFHTKSQSKVMQHALDILGELPIDSLISTYSSSRGKGIRGNV